MTDTKPYFAEGTPAMLALEGMVERVGLANMLYALAHISVARAEHFRANWQDHKAARTWDRHAIELGNLARKIRHTAQHGED